MSDQPKSPLDFSRTEVIEALEQDLDRCNIKLDRCRPCQLHTKTIQYLKQTIDQTVKLRSLIGLP